jgi:hypothetical protein
MLEISNFYGTKVQFTATTIDEVPKDHYDSKNWTEGPGVYYLKSADNLYFISKYSVDTIYNVTDKNLFTSIDNNFEEPKVNEELFLKALAASNGHRL